MKKPFEPTKVPPFIAIAKDELTLRVLEMALKEAGYKLDGDLLGFTRGNCWSGQKESQPCQRILWGYTPEIALSRQEHPKARIFQVDTELGALRQFLADSQKTKEVTGYLDCSSVKFTVTNKEVSFNSNIGFLSWKDLELFQKAKAELN